MACYRPFSAFGPSTPVLGKTGAHEFPLSPLPTAKARTRQQAADTHSGDRAPKTQFHSQHPPKS